MEDTDSSGPDFNYLLSMPMWNLTQEKKDTIIKNRDERQQELRKLKATSKEEIEGFEGCLEEIKELIESKKVKVNEVDENNVTALRFAAQFDHLDIVQYLLSKGASTKIKAKDGRDPLL